MKRFMMVLLAALFVAGSMTGALADEVKPLKVKLALTVPMDDAGGVGATEFQKVASELSGGKVKTNIFPACQLGGMREHYEACQAGAVEMVYVAASVAANFVPEIGILDMFYLFPTNYQDAWKVVDGRLTDFLSDKLAKKGFKLMGIAPYGYKQITSSKKPIQSMEDLDGMKIRVMPSKILISQYENLGANPTPIEFSELYVALQQGVVDGEENGLSVIKTQKFNEVQKYLTISDHGLFMGLMVSNLKWYEGLSDAQRAIIDKASAENIRVQREMVERDRETIIEYLSQNGMEVVRLTAEEQQKMREAVTPSREEFATLSEGHAEILKIVLEDMAQLQK